MGVKGKVNKGMGMKGKIEGNNGIGMKGKLLSPVLFITCVNTLPVPAHLLPALIVCVPSLFCSCLLSLFLSFLSFCLRLLFYFIIFVLFFIHVFVFVFLLVNFLFPPSRLLCSHSSSCPVFSFPGSHSFCFSSCLSSLSSFILLLCFLSSWFLFVLVFFLSFLFVLFHLLALFSFFLVLILFCFSSCLLSL